MKKIVFLLLSIGTTAHSMRREHECAPRSALTMEQHHEILAFTQDAYERYYHDASSRTKVDQLEEIFAECEQRFAQDAAMAKMYFYFRLTRHDRTMLEFTLLEHLNPADFLQRCPQFSDVDDQLPLFHMTKQGLFELDNPLAPINSAFVYFNPLMLLRHDIEKIEPKLLNILCNYLFSGNHAPFIIYVEEYCRRRELNFLQYLEKSADIYEKLRHALLMDSPTTIRAMISWYQLNPNHKWSDGTTPLSITTCTDNLAIMRTLLGLGADPATALPLAEKIARKTSPSPTSDDSETEVEYLDGYECVQHDAEHIIRTLKSDDSARYACHPKPCTIM